MALGKEVVSCERGTPVRVGTPVVAAAGWALWAGKGQGVYNGARWLECHVETFEVYKLGFNKNNYTFALIFLMKSFGVVKSIEQSS